MSSIALGDRAHLGEFVEPGADRQHGPDPGRPRARDHRLALGGEIGEIEMAVAVDQHRTPIPAAVMPPASTKRGKMPSGFGSRVPGTRGGCGESGEIARVRRHRELVEQPSPQSLA